MRESLDTHVRNVAFAYIEDFEADVFAFFVAVQPQNQEVQVATDVR